VYLVYALAYDAVFGAEGSAGFSGLLFELQSLLAGVILCAVFLSAIAEEFIGRDLKLST
jgi:hypothetical protein